MRPQGKPSETSTATDVLGDGYAGEVDRLRAVRTRPQDDALGRRQLREAHYAANGSDRQWLKGWMRRLDGAA